MTVPFRIREAGSDDNDRLIELARRCPSRGRLAVYSDRYPDFFAMTRQQGERSYVYVGESLHGDIVGCAVLIERTEQIEGATVKVLHLADLRVDPSMRNSKVAAELIAVYSDRLKSGNYHRGVIEVLKSNAAPSRANSLLVDQFDVRKEARVSMYKLLPIWNYHESPRWTYRQATPSDFPQLAKLLQSVYKNVVGAPPFSIEWLQSATQKHSSFTFANIWLAVNKEGSLEACLAQWDQKALRKTVVWRSSKANTFIVRLLALFGLLWRIPPLPAKGRALDYQYFRWLAAKPEHMPALKALMRFAMRKTREDGKCQFVMVGFQEGDRLKAAVRGILKIKEPMHIYSHRPKNFDINSSVRSSLSLSQKRAAPALRQALYIDLALI